MASSSSSRATRSRSSASSSSRCCDAAALERFEDAARYRNRLFSVRHLAERQAADRREFGTIDVIGIAAAGDRAAVQVFPLRDGKLVGRHSFHLENVEGQDIPTVLEAFVLEYYGSSPSVPPRDRRAAGGTRHRGARGVPVRAARGARRGAAAAARREAAAAGARDAERAARAGDGRSRDRAAAAAPRRGARGAARGAQPGEPAGAHRVLRHLEHPGRVAGRLDGRLLRTACRRRRTTASSGCASSRAQTTSRPWRRSSPAGSRACRT